MNIGDCECGFYSCDSATGSATGLYCNAVDDSTLKDIPLGSQLRCAIDPETKYYMGSINENCVHSENVIRSIEECQTALDALGTHAQVWKDYYGPANTQTYYTKSPGGCSYTHHGDRPLDKFGNFDTRGIEGKVGERRSQSAPVCMCSTKIVERAKAELSIGELGCAISIKCKNNNGRVLNEGPSCDCGSSSCNQTTGLYCYNSITPHKCSKDVSPIQYILQTEAESWSQSEANCVLLGTSCHLVSIHNKEENKIVQNMLQHTSWIGLNDIESEGSWVYSDNTTKKYVNWKKNGPNNGGSPKKKDIPTSGEFSLEDLGGSGCNKNSFCKQCQGDCDKDSECADGLTCFQRDKSSKLVPGCMAGGSGDIGSHDYCTSYGGEDGGTMNTNGRWNDLSISTKNPSVCKCTSHLSSAIGENTGTLTEEEAVRIIESSELSTNLSIAKQIPKVKNSEDSIDTLGSVGETDNLTTTGEIFIIFGSVVVSVCCILGWCCVEADSLNEEFCCSSSSCCSQCWADIIAYWFYHCCPRWGEQHCCNRQSRCCCCHRCPDGCLFRYCPVDIAQYELQRVARQRDRRKRDTFF